MPSQNRRVSTFFLAIKTNTNSMDYTSLGRLTSRREFNHIIQIIPTTSFRHMESHFSGRRQMPIRHQSKFPGFSGWHPWFILCVACEQTFDHHVSTQTDVLYIGVLLIEINRYYVMHVKHKKGEPCWDWNMAKAVCKLNKKKQLSV